MRKWMLLAVACTIACMGMAEDKIVGGPYTVQASARGATVVWVVEVAQVTVQAAGQAAKTSPAFRVEKTTLTGLTPNTRYEYEVGGKGLKGSFKTAPTPDQPYNFVLYGDNRTRHDVHRNVIAQLLKSGIPDFVVQTGDMVEDGNNNSLWPIFFDIERDLLRQTAMFPSLGNHERNAQDYYDFFPGTHAYYSFNWGNAHFTVFNSDIGNAAIGKNEKDAFWAEQTRWMEEDLAGAQAAEYRFVVAHHPPYSAVASRFPGNAHIAALVPIWEKYHVSAAMFGHDHNYQHYLKNGIHYVVCGGGGAPLYDVNSPTKDITVKLESVENFVKISVDGKIAKFKSIAIDGHTVDEFEVKGSAQAK